ncbi:MULTISPECIES: Asp23/Gls24 family envelope stress response protein [unclassified Streptomyces]|uniref:Asp23/Gls24 family envelope stress response protein n=1 Tax=unclassified Streptomyces TaxID=2593676 RepID=UPI0016609BB6|nr:MULTISPECIES: Asp23/Gls24 family envelope stress response protein [unclassified Streptomyces]MBD0709938.1 hypothetical protein [Streptomyces sp. CBMA291]MBD0718162.1 hypothetical protein [Streptomyces sp. CBMA370]
MAVDRAPGPPRAPGPARDRGATAIADRVVAKIAAQAAREAAGPAPEGGSKPHASVAVHRDSARIAVTLDLDYPADVGRRCGAVRRRVRARVEELAGLEVHEVTVQVERLHSALTRQSAGRDRVS